MIRLTLLLCATALLAGCSATAQPEPIVETVEVAVPVPVSCVPETIGDPERYEDTDAALLAAPDSAERYRLMIIGRSQRADRLGILEAVVRQCSEVSDD